MDKAYPSKTPMIVRALETKTGPFRPRDEVEKVLRPKYTYLSVIGALIYLSNNTRPDITFADNLLAGYNMAPTMCYWNGVKSILQYLQGTTYMGLFSIRKTKMQVCNWLYRCWLRKCHHYSKY
jgi:hypothetical protein